MPLNRPILTGLPAVALLLGAVAEPASVADAPRLRTFACRERLGLDWAQTLVTYQASFPKGRARPGQVRLVDDEGTEVPVQLWRVRTHDDGSIAAARVSFRADLPAGESYRYHLEAARPAVVADHPPKADTGGDFLTLDNGLVAIRLPKAGEVTFDPPLRFGSDHAAMLDLYGRQAAEGIAPGPIQGVRLQGGRWVGGSYFQAGDPEHAPKVLSYRCEVVEEGPLFVDAKVRYTFDGDRFYEMTARLLAGDPAVRIDEQFDLGKVGETRDRHAYAPNDGTLVVSMSDAWHSGGWRPDHAFWGRVAYGNSLEPENTPLESRLAELGFDFDSKAFGTSRIPYEEPARLIFGLEPWTPYGAFAAYFGLVDSHQVKAKESTPFLGVVPLHAGTWRADGPYSFKSLYGHKSDVALHWPLSAMVHPNRPIHTGEYDPELPYTFGRRVWALVGGPLQTVQELDAMRKVEGYINLDDYKDWILAWRADPKVTYPRLLFGPEDVARWKAGLAKHPVGPLLKEFLYFGENAERREELYARVTSERSTWTSALGQTREALGHWFPIWRQAHKTGQWAPAVDELLSDPGLSQEQREQIRCYLAAVGNLVTEPDFLPRGSMAHIGTVNMAIVRFLPLPHVAALIPDHPRAKEWLDASEAFVRYKLAVDVAPGGGWSELHTYYDASVPALTHAVHVLHRTGRMSEEDLARASQLTTFPLRFYAPPDPRFGVRVVPCWGHECTKNFGQWLPGAALLRESDPETAKALLWGWDQGGRLAGYHDKELNRHCAAYADLLNSLPGDYVPDEIDSAWVPGIGAVLRAHAGRPNETFLSYRQGYMISHCDDNQGAFLLYADGAPLVGVSLFGYPLHQYDPYVDLHLNFGWFSALRFGSRDNVANMRDGANDTDKVGAWNPSSAVHRHAFGPSVDYLRGYTDNSPQRWTRQILMLKGRADDGPDYFVFRDSAEPLDGDPASLVPKWWTLRTIGPKEQVRTAADAIHYQSEFGPQLDVRFLQPGKIRAETRDASRSHRTVYGHVDTWRDENGEPMVVSDQETWTDTTETLSVTSVGPIEPGEDVLSVLYPRREKEPAAKYEPVADGVARITTPEGTDWVFADDRGVEFDGEFDGGEVRFRGRAGAVRVFPQEVHLVLLEGPGEVAFQGTVLKSPIAATRVIPRSQLSRPKTIEVPAPESSIEFALDPKDGPITQLVRGVRRQDRDEGPAYAFDAEELICLDYGGAVFVGRRGGIEVDRESQSVRLVMIDGERVGYGQLLAWGADGPYEVTIGPDRVTGRCEGPGRTLRLVQPAGIDRMSTLVVDGIAYAPGIYGSIPPEAAARDPAPAAPPAAPRTFVVPLQDGEHEFELRNLAQPPVFRNWQRW